MHILLVDLFYFINSLNLTGFLAFTIEREIRIFYELSSRFSIVVIQGQT